MQGAESLAPCGLVSVEKAFLEAFGLDVAKGHRMPLHILFRDAEFAGFALRKRRVDSLTPRFARAATSLLQVAHHFYQLLIPLSLCSYFVMFFQVLSETRLPTQSLDCSLLAICVQLGWEHSGYSQ